MANVSDEDAAATEMSLSSNHEDWIKIQESLKKVLIEEDDFKWKLPNPKSTSSTQSIPIEEEEERELEELKYVGGFDVSFSKEDPSIACGSLVVLELPGMKVTYHDFSLVRLYVHYVPGFLAFREAPLLLDLLENMKKQANQFYPQLLMVDGNGVLHPRGFGLACHLGVLTDLPAIGIGKNLHHVDGLTQSGVIQLLKAKESSGEEFVTLMGRSGRTWGVADIISREHIRKSPNLVGILEIKSSDY
ncbi:endonuclease V isoform X2 [Tripterygium wilfordii]|uniref:endonuclease V isoform X2 n=1 Tax=Tripterygium wilfordii TaxID=458696 RepID=UPI0018F845C9|nr:endonuclease V isoform X2 [Tripterygium wilfordii]